MEGGWLFFFFCYGLPFSRKKVGEVERTYFGVAKLNIQNHKMNRFISPVKVILAYFACVIVAKFHKWTTTK